MDYQKAFLEAHEQVFLVSCELSTKQKADDVQYNILLNIEILIEQFVKNYDKLIPERKQTAKDVINRLQFVYSNLGVIYANSLKNRIENIKLNESISKLIEENKALKERIETIEKMNGF